MAKIKNKIALPFKIIKSEVSGGFIDKVHNSFTGSIDIVNTGEDIVNGYFEGNLQSPFTKKWIGGKSHRHTPLNNGLDSSKTRPEAWHLEFTEEVPAEVFQITDDFSTYSNNEKLLANDVFQGDGSSEIRTRTIDVPNKKYYVLADQSGYGRYLETKYLGGQITQLTYTYLVFTLNGIQYDYNGGAYEFGGDGLGLEDPDSSENLVLEYSDDGVVWNTKKTIFFGSTTVGSPYYVEQTEVIDFSAERPNYVRFRQTFASETAGDNYAITDIDISVERALQKGKISFYSHAYRGSPPAYWTREEYSKRPLNIRNIRHSSSLEAGNFLENYEVVQTSGRRITNNLFVDNFLATGELSTRFITGSSEYSLPLLNKISGSRSVIVERFNAPGSKEESSRGALDREGEEMSPNIPMPFRNIKIRQPFYRQLAQHNPQFGSGTTYKILPEVGNTEAVTIHKVNRNRLVKGEREYFDNGFVTHAIPRTDIQYSWITASATTLASELGGYQSFKNIDSSGSYYNRSHAFEDISFIDGTHFGFYEEYLLDEFSLPFLLDNEEFILISGELTNATLDNVYINSLIKDSKNINVECRTFTTEITDVTPTYSEITNSPYTFTTWTSIRGNQHPITRQLRKNNYISTTTECENYIDPVVTFKYKPLQHRLKTNTEEVEYEIKHTYTNNLSSFANKDLLERLYEDREEDDREQFYNELYDLYVSPEGTNPIADFSSYTYKEVIWPKEENTSLAKTRKRSAYYLDTSGSSRDGYDRQLGTQRAFWRDTEKDRKRTVNSLGGYTSSIDYPSTLETGSNFGNFYAGLLGNWEEYTTFDATTIEYVHQMATSSAQDSGLYNSVSIHDNASAEQEIYVYLLDSYLSGSNYTKQVSPWAKKANKFEVAGEFNHNFIHMYGMSAYTGSDIKYDVGTIYANTYYKSLHTAYADNFDNIIKNDNDEVLLNPKVRFTAFVGGAELNTGSAVQDLFSPNRDIVFEGEEHFDLFRQELSGSDVYYSTLDFGLQRVTEKVSGRKPFFDSYEEFIKDIRPLTKEYSTLPEFRISEHMKYYEGTNFELENKKLFSLDGAEGQYRSAESETGTSNTEFYKTYLQSDLTKRHDKVKEDNLENSKIKSITIKVSGIKKLLPYNGFYPRERSVQLANLYAEYAEDNLRGGLYSLTHEDGGDKQTLFEHIDCHVVPLESIAPPPTENAPEAECAEVTGYYMTSQSDTQQTITFADETCVEYFDKAEYASLMDNNCSFISSNYTLSFHFSIDNMSVKLKTATYTQSNSISGTTNVSNNSFDYSPVSSWAKLTLTFDNSVTATEITEGQEATCTVTKHIIINSPRG